MGNRGRHRSLKLALLLVVLLTGWSVQTARAESRTPPEATAHAIDELANAVAQGKITLTPTPTPTHMPVSKPATATPTPLQQADPTPAPTPLPDLPPSDEGISAYTRPLSDPWIELALPQGRWAIYTADCQISSWSNVVLAGNNIWDYSGNSCQIVAYQWLSDSPCSQNDQEQCDVAADDSYWYMLSLTPTPIPTDTPTPKPTLVQASAQNSQPASRPVSRLEPPAQPTDTEVPTETPTVTVTPTMTVTSTPTYRVATSTPTVGATVTPNPTVNSTSDNVDIRKGWSELGGSIGAMLLGASVVSSGIFYMWWRMR